MRKESFIIIILAGVLVVVFGFIFTQNYLSYSKMNTIIQNPFDAIEVLGEKIRIKDNVRTYEVEVDCSTIEDNSEQIIYYRLNEDYKEYKVSVSSIIYNGNKILNDDYADMTGFSSEISAIDPDNKYEQIFHIKATCITTNDETTSTTEENEEETE